MDTREAKPIRILYAEDDEDDFFFFRDALAESKINAELITVGNGNALMQILGKVKPEIIFLDINIPLKNGKECLREIRLNKWLDSVPVIIISTSSFKKDILSTFENGANMYVAKPNFFLEYVEIIKKIFFPNWEKELLNRKKENFFLSIGFNVHET